VELILIDRATRGLKIRLLNTFFFEKPRTLSGIYCFKKKIEFESLHTPARSIVHSLSHCPVLVFFLLFSNNLGNIEAGDIPSTELEYC
jgi:hypothetical protein